MQHPDKKVVKEAINAIKTGEKFTFRKVLAEECFGNGCIFNQYMELYGIEIEYKCSTSCRNCYMSLAKYIVNHYGGVQYEQ